MESRGDFISVRQCSSPPGLKTVFCFVVLGCLTFTVQNDGLHVQNLTLEEYFHMHMLKRKKGYKNVYIQYQKYFVPSS